MPMPGLYVCGWLKRGPSGIIGSNLVCAQETVQCVQADLAAGVLPRPTRHTAGLRALLQERGVKVVDRHGWARIDAREVADGAAKDKPREKLTCSEQLLSVGGQREAS
jgi:NADPH-dependent glutamate synthase beta subunit-like oxidoreductase